MPAEMGLLNSIMPGVAGVAPFLWTAFAVRPRPFRACFFRATWLAAAAEHPPSQRSAVLSRPRPPRFSGGLPDTARYPFANSMTFELLRGGPQGYAAS